MKTILLLRHAKSSWDEPHLEDFSRPLAPRGIKAASRMGRLLTREGLVPARVLCSGARRAVETWQWVSSELQESVPTEFRDEIYHASPRDLIQLIQALPDGEDSVLLIGHNPTFESLALRLAGSGKDEAFRTMTLKFPTGAMAILDFRVEGWKDVEEGKGELRDFIRPKALK